MIFYFMIGFWFDEMGFEIIEFIVIIEGVLELLVLVLCKLFVKDQGDVVDVVYFFVDYGDG